MNAPVSEDHLKTAVVLIGHGSRRGKANVGFEKYVAAYRAAHPEYTVSHGYVELAEPFMGDAIRDAARDHDRVVAMPLLLFRSGHAKNDLPMVLNEIRSEFPERELLAADTLGVHPDLCDLVFRRASETELMPAAKTSVAAGDDDDRYKAALANTAVIFVGRGSSDPDANGDFYKQMRIFAEGRGFGWVLPCFIGITEPSLDQALNLISRTRPERVILAPYFLQPGVLIERIREQVEKFRKEYPWVQAAVADPLGMDDAILNVVHERIRQALSGQNALPCDTCKFRVAMPDQEEHVGGLKALLWSARHSFTHNQAMPHEHAHKPIRKHVLVCGNVDCAANGSIRALTALRSGLKRRGLLKEVLVTQTSCMGHCGAGPNVVVYPDGIWYRGVVEGDIEELIDEHLVGDRLVARLVDNIM
ncbi:MAG: NAD(P)H-dependent oxidoreductase subunit E [bacterium]|nr:NAD(P)H-dependent oxidoreductase subunit E [bacterium]